MPLDPEDPRVRAAVFGKQVEDFLQSDIGDYLLQRATSDERDAIEELISAKEGEDTRDIRRRIYCARSVQTWLADAIQQGRGSAELIGAEED